MAHAKRKARVQTSVIRKEARHPNISPGSFNPVAHYGSLIITDTIVRAGTTSGRFSTARIYSFPRWNFDKGRAEGVPL